MPLVATTVWTISPELVLALDEQLGPPVDSYVNGSQTWLVDDGPIDARVAAAPGRRVPAARPASRTTTSGRRSSSQLSPAGDPHALRLGTEVRPLTALWDGLECFAAYGDELEPQRLAAAATAQLGRPPDRFGLVDHEAIGDAWERANGDVSIVALLLDAARRRDAVIAARRARCGSRGSSYQAGQLLAVDRAEREVEPAVRAGERLRQRVAREEADRATSRADGPCSSPPIMRQWNTIEYIGTRAKPSRRPSSTAISDTGSHSMPVSSSTSFIAISDGE